MPATRILFVKLSSLGDVVHLLPAVTDLVERKPGVEVLWAVEEPYVDLVRLHRAVREAIGVNLRALRRAPWSPSQWRRFGAARRRLRRSGVERVIDAQGLIKSAVVARMARVPVFGFDRTSAREPLATRLYDVKLAVPRELHAVERNRRLVARVFGYDSQGTPRYGLDAPQAPPAWAPPDRYVVLLHAASRADKRWSEASWLALARRLREHGFTPVFPGGSNAERATAARLASAVSGAIAAPPMALAEAAALLAHAHGVVGVDTGLTHLAVAFDVPTVGIYCATDPALTGLHGGARAINLGGRGAAPGVEAVVQAIGLEARA
jgi:lipopolysaccharide heptosyltransferase I